VLEIGTNHFGEVGYLAKIAKPNIAIITNIGPSHLGYFKNLEGVFKEKGALLDNLKEPSIAILNADDGLLREKVIAKRGRPIVFGFGIKNPADFRATDIKIINTKIEFSVNKKYRFTPLDGRSKIDKAERHLTGFTLKALGYYNIYNALAVVAIARLFGMGYKDIADRLASFNFLENRLKLIELDKVRFINDTYNSNPLSLKQALDTLSNFKTKGKKIFVMGDMLELGRGEELFHSQAGCQIPGVCDIFITVGRLSKITASAARRCGMNSKNIFTCESSIQARDILFKGLSIKPDDIVLVKGSRAMRMEEVFPT
ncbi:MAG: UDP-N-acetylmuramoyl-tripeptide--D-alanyl-D-alanine ligase, partial [Candidatus Omnitrophica bacterium]|nr:UDP-N-acetylmuramoyl-tripeptide--D-alanyl-D-alanine ligase [Candidatus Omnitrophota bacterium]